MDSMNKEAPNDIIFRRMAPLISSCWFFIANSLILLISFIARQVFRIFKIEDSSRKDDYDVLAMEARCQELARIFAELEGRDYDFLEPKESSSFSFRFQHQISGDQRGSNEEAVAPIPRKEEPMIPAAEGEEPSSITTSVSKYRFLSEKDFSGFVEEPEAKTFRVEESYIGSETDYLYDKDTVDNRSDASSLSAKKFPQPTVEDVNVANLTTSIKNKRMEKEKAVSYETSPPGEREVGSLSAKNLQELSVEDVSTDSLNERRKLGRSEDEILVGNKHPEKEKGINYGTEKEVGVLSAKNFHVPAVEDVSTDSLNERRKLGKLEDAMSIKSKHLEKEKRVNCETASLGEKEVGVLAAKNFQVQSVEEVGADSLNAIRKLGESEDGMLIRNKLLKKEKAINYDEGGGFLSAKKIQEPRVEDVGTYTRKRGKSEDVILMKNKLLEKEMAVGSKTGSLGEKGAMDGARLLSEDFYGFDSDTESPSFSDGYSVKDLIMDSDSEAFLSEGDFVGNEHGSDTTEASMDTTGYKAELLEDIHKLEEAQLQFNYSTDAESADFRGCFPDAENRIHFENIDSDDVWSEDEFSKPESEQKEVGEGEAESREVQGVKERKWTGSNAARLEFTDSSDDELYSIQNTCGCGKSLDEVPFAGDSVNPDTALEDLDGKEAEDLAKICDFQKNESESSNTRCDASTGRPLRAIHLAEQEDSVELGREMDGRVQKSELGSEKKSPEKKDVKESGGNDLKHSDDEDSDDEDFDELESLWEHQDLIEQLKMELRKARATGLPTIFEESESPKTVEDLKPWKIDEQFLHEDPMDELHKFYKSYRERMRKFDILNYQKMYAIGFLQLKDPLQSMGSQKPLVSTITSIISQSFMPCRHKSDTDPSEKFIKELQDDLEMVYVGQTCLSWEFLRWQYEKARELPESDPYRSHQYNQVAGEFQQFQVMLQRFIENESFQGPRLPNYVKNRCVLQNLLLVPVIKVDCLKDKLEEQRKGNDAITSEMLEDIMEESIRIFWEFVKADRDETPVILKGLLRAQVELQDPSDYELMMDIQAILQKKEKKLKDILRTGNCLVKKFKKPKEDRSNQDLFFSQVDLKLVARVLKMSRISTDQLVWCHKKLNKIDFVDRKILREPAFLLFPC